MHTVFLRYAALGLLQRGGQLRQKFQIILAAVLEYACLYVVVALVGIVVDCAQPLLGLLVYAHIFLVALGGCREPVLYRHSQCQAHAAVGLRLGREHRHGHLLQTAYQTVIACYLVLCLLNVVLKRQLLALECLVLLRRLMAGVCKVKHIAFLLRIEHQRVLVAAVHYAYQLGKHLLGALLFRLALLRQLAVDSCQLGAQYSQGVVQVLFFQDSTCVCYSCNEQQQYYYYPIDFVESHFINFFKFECKDTNFF